MDELTANAGADDAIYQKMLSEWLVDPTDLAKSEDLNWESVWDHGWSAAAAAEDAPVQSTPRRVCRCVSPACVWCPAQSIPPVPKARPAGLATSTAMLTGATAATTRYHRRLSSAPPEDRFRRAIRTPSVRASATTSVVCVPVDHMPKEPEEPITNDLSATLDAA